jgi:hypothetical protein
VANEEQAISGPSVFLHVVCVIFTFVRYSFLWLGGGKLVVVLCAPRCSGGLLWRGKEGTISEDSLQLRLRNRTQASLLRRCIKPNKTAWMRAHRTTAGPERRRASLLLSVR